MNALTRLSFVAIALGALAACGGDPECTTGEFDCDGDMLLECVDEVWEDSQDCAADGMMCHADGGHCMEMSETMDSGMSM
jgi:hypothetical protein